MSGWRQEQRTDYEELVLTYLYRRLAEDSKPFPSGSDFKLAVDHVRLDKGEGGNDIVILFREVNRPECWFGFSMNASEPPALDGLIYPDPESWSEVILANLEEELLAAGHGLPYECDPDGVTWI